MVSRLRYKPKTSKIWIKNANQISFIPKVQCHDPYWIQYKMWSMKILNCLKCSVFSTVCINEWPKTVLERFALQLHTQLRFQSSLGQPLWGILWFSSVSLDNDHYLQYHHQFTIHHHPHHSILCNLWRWESIWWPQWE